MGISAKMEIPLFFLPPTLWLMDDSTLFHARSIPAQIMFDVAQSTPWMYFQSKGYPTSCYDCPDFVYVISMVHLHWYWSVAIQNARLQHSGRCWYKKVEYLGHLFVTYTPLVSAGIASAWRSTWNLLRIFPIWFEKRHDSSNFFYQLLQLALQVCSGESEREREHLIACSHVDALIVQVWRSFSLFMNILGYRFSKT